MTVDLHGLLENAARAAGGTYRHTLSELATHLAQLRERTAAGDLAAVDEFFAVYRISPARG